MSADHTVSRFVSEKTYQKRKMVSKLNEFFGITDIVIFADGLIVLDGTVLGKSDYESGSSLPTKFHHIPRGDTFDFICNIRMSLTKTSNSHHLSSFQ